MVCVHTYHAVFLGTHYDMMPEPGADLVAIYVSVWLTQIGINTGYSREWLLKLLLSTLTRTIGYCYIFGGFYKEGGRVR